MRTTPAKKNKKAWSIVRTYWMHLLFIFFLVNYVIVRTLELQFFAANCMTRSEMQSDSRCLYSYNGNIYEKGSRNRPHHGHACGSDVTREMPSGHIRNMARYLDPTLIGSICTDSPSSTQTPTPTVARTNTPTPTVRSTNTPTPTHVPSNTPSPTTVRQPDSTPAPIRSYTGTPTNTPVKAATFSPTPTKKMVMIATPTPTSEVNHISAGITGTPGIGKFGMKNQLANVQISQPTHETEPPLIPIVKPVVTESKSNADIGQKIILWSEILVVVSFLLLVVTLGIGVFKRLRTNK